MSKSWNLKENDGILTIEFDKPDTAVNTLTTENMTEFINVLRDVSKRTDLKAILFTSAKDRFFIAGADINEIRSISTKADAKVKADLGKDVFQRIENLKVPTVCVINGACLGGGYEFALACSHRVASTSDDVKIGLPEVNLGILPGFGGSIRLPRLLGLAKSLPLILGGQIVNAKKAFKLGMVDRLFSAEELFSKSQIFADNLANKKTKPKYYPALKVAFEKYLLGPFLMFPAAKKNVMKKTKGHYPAPLQIIELIRRSYGINLPEAFRMESEDFAELAVTPISKNLISLFFMNEKYKKLKWSKFEGPIAKMKSCAVIGAGIMGGGIAQLTSHRGLETRLKDIRKEALDSAIKEAQRIYQGEVERKKMRESDVEQKMKLISIDAEDSLIGNSDMIIEAVVEDLGIKKKIFKEWGAKVSAHTIIASNTSSLPVTQMAAESLRPENVVGVHFFNPVNRMPLVEVIRAKQTSEETLEKAIAFARQLGKTVIVTADAPGFLVNRLLLPYLNEAAYLLEEGVSPERIDQIACQFGMPMGPVELVDQVGIDVGYKVAHILQEAFGDRMKVASILERVKAKGFLGKKSGKGFYLYGDGKSRQINPEIEWPKSKNTELTDDQILKRLIYIMINEAARCLDEGVIDQPSTVDIGMIMGTGFPPFRAGLLHYADSIGLDLIVKDLKDLQRTVDSKRFEPSAYLEKLSLNKKTFY